MRSAKNGPRVGARDTVRRFHDALRQSGNSATLELDATTARTPASTRTRWVAEMPLWQICDAMDEG